jgi:sigma-B regulation protein RsbU (phosphoserine phosphatase)
MIELGAISVAQAGSVGEAREKVREALADLTGNTMVASRIAGVTSHLARALRRGADDGRIVVRLDRSGQLLVFVLDFVGIRDASESFPVSSFFDSSTRVRVEGEPALRLTIELSSTPTTTLTDRQLARVQAGIRKKGRDALLEEVQAKNRELQESFDNLQRTTAAKERMEGELNIARDIQMSMLPLDFPPFPHRNEFTIFASLYPAREVGGDFYDFFLIDEDRFCFCVGDVSGKGVPAALFMAVTKTLIKSRATNDFSPASILTHVNDEIAENNDSAMFVTMWVGILDVSTGELVYTNAGHNPPYIRRADSTLERVAERHGPVIGAVDGIVYGEDSIHLETDDIVFLYTDGITEAMDPDGSLYEEDRLVTVLSSRDFESVEEIVEASTDDVWRFQADAEQADDVTVLAVKFFGRAEGADDVASLHLVAKNRLAEIDRINDSFESFSAEHGLPSRLRRSMKLVFDDLLNNVISYAYHDEDEHSIDIHVELSSDRMSVRISDDGHPFNPFSEVDAATGGDLEDRDIGGLGIHLVKSLMDEVSYTRRTDMNVVVLVKYLADHISTEQAES